MATSAAQNPLSISPPEVVLKRRGILPSHPVTTTVFAAFEQTARAHGAKPFLQFFPDKLELSYAQAHERSSALARIYEHKGYRTGHRVALRLPNCADFP